MPANSRKSRIWLAVLSVAFLFGLIELLLLRFETGDIYPPYSTLRADPMGSKILFESLAALPALRVQRNYEDLDKLKSPHAALFFLGLSSAQWDSLPLRDFENYEKLLANGGRLILAFAPVNEGPRSSTPEPKQESTDRVDPKDKPVETGDRWGVAFHFSKPWTINGDRRTPRATVLYFKLLDPSWKMLAGTEAKPTAAERPLGKGTLVLVADSYPLSNESIARQRNTPYLVRITGQISWLIFDESHLGIRETGSIGKLIRQYGLTGLFVGLLIVGLLYIWKNSVSFPPPAATLQDRTLAGKEASEGFVSLLRRSIPASQLLTTCYAQWSKSVIHGRPIPEPRLKQIRGILAEPDARRNPLETYRIISRILKERS